MTLKVPLWITKAFQKNKKNKKKGKPPKKQTKQKKKINILSSATTFFIKIEFLYYINVLVAMANHIHNLLALCLKAIEDASASKRQVADLEKQNTELQAQNSGLQAENARLQAKNTELQETMTYREEASVALSNELHTHIHELNCEIDALLQQRFQESVPEYNLLRSLQNPYSWMMTEGIHDHITILAKLLLEHQANMAECGKHEQENARLQLQIDEKLQKKIDPTDLLDRQSDISGKMEGCYQTRDVLAKRVESCLKTLFQVFASAQDE